MSNNVKLSVNDIARVCHEVNRAYCQALGDNSQVEWESAPEWQHDSAKSGVLMHLNHPDAPASESHRCWMEGKLADDWKYGEVKDPAKKEHPCMVAFEELPKEQQAKDYIFKAVVGALAKFA
jgi:hypothetical protein|nr:MAG TPA: RyR domain [Caudoviricetes sp.]